MEKNNISAVLSGVLASIGFIAFFAFNVWIGFSVPSLKVDMGALDTRWIMLLLAIGTAIALFLGRSLLRSSLTLQQKISWGMVTWWWYLTILTYYAFRLLPSLNSGYPFDLLAQIPDLIFQGFFIIIFIPIGMQLMPMLLIGLIGTHYIQSSSSEAHKRIIALGTFLVAGLFYFARPILYSSLFLGASREFEGLEGGLFALIFIPFISIVLTIVAFKLFNSSFHRMVLIALHVWVFLCIIAFLFILQYWRLIQLAGRINS